MSTDVTSAGGIAGEEKEQDDGITIVIAHENPPHDGVDTTTRAPIQSIQCPQPSCSQELIWEERRALCALNYINCGSFICSKGALQKAFFCENCKIAYCRHIVPDTEFDEYQLRMGLSQLLDRLEDIATSRSGLDVYQAAAILKCLDSVGRPGIFRFAASFGAVIAAIVQVLGCCMFIIQLIKDRMEVSDKFCDPTHNFFGKLLAASLVITVVGTVQFSSIMAHSEQGLYPLVVTVYDTPYSYIADRLATRSMVMFGYIVNFLCMTLTMIGSAVIVYTADSVPNLLLNSAALLFLVEIDDYFVTFWIYKKLESFVDCFKEDMKQMDGREIQHIQEPENVFDSLPNDDGDDGKKMNEWQCIEWRAPIVPNLQKVLNGQYAVDFHPCFCNSPRCSSVFKRLKFWLNLFHNIIFCFAFFGMPILLFVCY